MHSLAVVCNSYERVPCAPPSGGCLWWLADPEQSRGLFEFADANKDGVIDTQEFAQFLESTRAANAEDASVRPLTSKELGQLFTRSAIGQWQFSGGSHSLGC